MGSVVWRRASAISALERLRRGAAACVAYLCWAGRGHGLGLAAAKFDARVLPRTLGLASVAAGGARRESGS